MYVCIFSDLLFTVSPFSVGQVRSSHCEICVSFSIHEVCFFVFGSQRLVFFKGELGNTGDLRWLCEIFVTGLVANSVRLVRRNIRGLGCGVIRYFGVHSKVGPYRIY